MEYKRKRKPLRHILSMPFIYSVMVPFVLLDIILETYHRLCFPLYGMKYVKRGDHIAIDRHKLSYLKPWDKLNCMYCGYANGLLSFAAEVVARTELYWCGIKHETNTKQKHQAKFLKYGDERAFRKKYT